MAAGWFTTDHLLAIAAFAAVIVAVVAIVVSNRMVTRQLAQDREALSTSIRPIIADLPQMPGDDFRAGEVTFDHSDVNVTIKVPVRNIGLGPAFIHDAFLEQWQRGKAAATTRHRVLPSHETTHFFTTVAAGEPLFSWLRSRPKSFAIGITYSDIAGHERTQSVLHLGGPNYATTYSVQMVQLFHCDRSGSVLTSPLHTPPIYS